MKRILAPLLLALLLVLLLPATAFAAEYVPAAEFEYQIIPNNSGKIESNYDPSTGTLYAYLQSAPDWVDAKDPNPDFVHFKMNVKNAATEARRLSVGNFNVPEVIKANDFISIGRNYHKPASGDLQPWFDSITLKWFASTDTNHENPLKTQSLSLHIIPAYVALDVPVSRIEIDSAAKSGMVAKSNGNVSYPLYALNGRATVTTLVSKPAQATKYSLNNSTPTTLIPGNGKVEVPESVPASLTNSQTTDNTIKWYDSSDHLIATEKLRTVITPATTPAYTPVKTDWVKVNQNENADTMLSGISSAIPDSSGDLNGDVTITCNLSTEAQWREAYSQSVDGNFVTMPFFFQLPGNAVSAACFGATPGNDPEAEDSKNLNLLTSQSYSPLGSNKILYNFIEIAGASYDGTTAVIRPIKERKSFYFKWIDTDGVEHFHKMTYDLSQSSPSAVKLLSATPARDRLVFNSDKATYIDNDATTYESGTVTYYASNVSSADQPVYTTLNAPTGYTLNQVIRGNTTSHVGDTNVSLRLDFRDEWTVHNGITVEWKNTTSGNTLTEKLFVTAIPKYRDVWMKEQWTPLSAGNNRFSVESSSVASNITHTDDGHIVFDIHNESALDLNAMINGSSRYFSLKAPAGATHFSVAFWQNSLYGNVTAANVSTQLKDAHRYPIDNFDNVGGITPNGTQDGVLFTLGGYLLQATELKDSDGLTIYTVQPSMAGYAQSMVIQWYDAYGNLINVDGKDGDYIYLTAKSYFKESGETGALSAEPQKSYQYPIVVANNATGFKLKTDIPLQSQNGQNGWNYLYMTMKYLDEHDQEVNPEPGQPVTIFIPFPEGMNATNAANYLITLRHYTKPDHSEYEDFSIELGNLEVTPYGLKFNVSSFSPFLLGYKEVSAPSSSSSYSSGSGSYGLPVILSPLSETIVTAGVGQQASLSVTSTGGVTYQWYRYGNGWEAISGASQSSYLTPSVSPANNGDRYFCRVTNGYGYVDSPVFRLQVGTALVPPKTGERPSSIIYLALLIPCAIGLAAAQQRKKSSKAD